MRRLAAVVAVGVLTACGSSAPDPAGRPTPTASATRKPKPKKPTPTPSATRKPKPKPKPTASPTPTVAPATGDPIGTQEALLNLVDPGEPRPANDCAAAAPDITRATCTVVETAGGTLLAVSGRLDGPKIIRLMVPAADGKYVNRYEGRDDGRSWSHVRVYAAPLTGKGTDGVVFAVRLTDRALTYDLLTWVSGGPLVRRAHRGPLADGALVPKDGALEEYAQATDGSYVKRRVAWDGRQFLLSAGQRSAAPPR